MGNPEDLYLCLFADACFAGEKEGACTVALQWGILLVCHAVKAMAWCAEVALFC